jgi:diguanylate cyclase (GGDEF)-like protein
MSIERHDTLTTGKGQLPALELPAKGTAHLLITQGEGVGRQFQMKETPLVVGRSSDCDLRLLNRAVSRLHCRMWRDATGHWLRDLNSTNKTYLNDRPVVEARLKDGDLIMVGGTVMQFVEVEPEVRPAAAEEVKAQQSDSLDLNGADAMTGLPTRRSFDADVEREIARCRRHGRTFVLASIDIDGLAAINRDYGQAAGDEAIRQVARMIRAGLRVEDLAARVGPDEVGVLLTEVGLDHGIPILQSIRSAASNAEFVHSGRSFKLTVSVGVALWDATIENRAELVHRVQAQLMRAKNSGKNQVCV